MNRYQLSIYAEKLPKGIIFKPNPYATVKVTGGPRDGETIGTTEVVHSTQSPDFVKVFFLETNATINLPITISVYNDRDESKLAEATFEATEVFVAPGHFLSYKANNGATIYASIEESMKGTSSGLCTIQLRGLDIKNVEPGVLGLGRSDPFFEISRKNADHAAGVVRWNTVFRSPYITDHLNPFWDEFTLTLEELCYGEINWPIKITVFDHNRNGKHKEIGYCETTIYEMSQRVAIRGNADRFVAYEISKEETSMTCGLMVVLQAEIQFQESSLIAPSFVDNNLQQPPPPPPQYHPPTSAAAIHPNENNTHNNPMTAAALATTTTSSSVPPPNSNNNYNDTYTTDYNMTTNPTTTTTTTNAYTSSNNNSFSHRPDPPSEI